jgi:predicted cobalt transporter CbtA
VGAEAKERIRGACQGSTAFILWGIGAFVGTNLAGQVLGRHTLTGPGGAVLHDWRSIWTTPAVGAVAVLGVFLIFFREPLRCDSDLQLLHESRRSTPEAGTDQRPEGSHT